MLSMGMVSEGATCEYLEKITIDDDVEKFFHLETISMLLETM